MADEGELEAVTFAIESSVLDGVPVRVLHFELTETLDEPYLAQIDLGLDDRDVDPVELLGRDVVLHIDRAPLSRRVCGVVRTAWEGEPEGGTVHGRVEVVPAYALLSLTRNTRIFQEKTAPEVLEAVLSERLALYGREVRLELSGAYPRREHCVQYQESDLAFTQRLMEEEGISYAFEHDGDVEVMVLRDANASYARASTVRHPIELQPSDLQARDREVVHTLELRHAHTTTAVVVRDFDWTTERFVVEEGSGSADARGRTRESYEHGLGRSLVLGDYDSAAKRYQANDAGRQQSLRLEAYTELGRVAEGVGRVIGFEPGTTFELAGHPVAVLDGEYLITRVVHASRPLDGEGADREPEPYHNRFECIPLEVPRRPRRRTPKPRIPGVQTALVTGPAGEEIHTDEHGRVKVLFHWDRDGARDETSSCWVRCEQSWAGAGWGFFWLPRVGMEVVVQFLDGDPDRPLVTGCVYDGGHTTPYSLPDEKTKSTIKSSSSPGGDGFNELRFEDRAGAEQIYVHAQKDYVERVEHDHTTRVHREQTNEVDGNQTQTVGGDQTERIDAVQRLSVGGDRQVHVEGSFEETVDGTETRMVTGDVTETFDANETRAISVDLTETVGGDEARSVGGDQTETVGGTHTLTVGAAHTLTVGGGLTQSVTGGITQTTPASYDLTAVGGLTVDAAGGVTWVAPGGITILAPGGTFIMDFYNSWSGCEWANCAGYAETTNAFKLEAGGWHYEICATRLENYSVFVDVNVTDLRKDGSKLKIKGAEVEAAAFQAWQDLLHAVG